MAAVDSRTGGADQSSVPSRASNALRYRLLSCGVTAAPAGAAPIATATTTTTATQQRRKRFTMAVSVTRRAVGGRAGASVGAVELGDRAPKQQNSGEHDDRELHEDRDFPAEQRERWIEVRGGPR